MSEALSVVENISSTILTQKELGAYYTPKDLTEALSKWAIRSPHEQVLEPSFGGCGFLQSAVNRLSELGCDLPHAFLYGCDIDPRAFDYLSEKLNALEAINHRFLHKDFLQVKPEDFLAHSFSSIIGNPPYISLHNLSLDQKKSVEYWRENNPELKLSKRASLWAYFLLHSLSFLQQNGRMAWVLPGSFLNADYGKQLNQLLLRKFGHISAFILGERAFLNEGTEERTIVLLCDQYGQTTEKAQIQYCSSLLELVNILYSLEPGENLAETTSIEAYEDIVNNYNIISLGDLASVLIGTVTGANKFFVLKPSDVMALKIEQQYLSPIFTKFSHAESLNISASDLQKWKNNNYPYQLLHLDNENDASTAVRAYASTFDESAKLDNKTFRKRACWLASDDRRIPDAFLSYMNHNGPRLVLNEVNINSTNSIHRVFFKKELTQTDKKLVAISLFTSFSQTSAELEGRSYGSGVLKIEPSEAKRIKLIFPNDKSELEIDSVFNQINIYLRENNYVKAQGTANKFLLKDSIRDINKIEALLSDLRNKRRRK